MDHKGIARTAHDKVHIVRDADGVVYGTDGAGFGMWGGRPLTFSRSCAEKMIGKGRGAYDGACVRIENVEVVA
jgi:hypothetical protein